MGMNNCTFMGRLTRDPEHGQTQSGVAWSRFCIAIDRSYAKKGEERQSDFIDCLAWRGTADFIANYFRKGDMIAVAGSMQTGTYEKEGVKRKTCECLVREASFCGSKSQSQSSDARVDGFQQIDDSDIPF